MYADFASEDVANYSNGSQNLTIIVLSLVSVSCAEKPSTDYVYKRLSCFRWTEWWIFLWLMYILKAAVTSLDIKEGDPSLGKSVGAYYSIGVFYCSGKRSHW